MSKVNIEATTSLSEIVKAAGKKLKASFKIETFESKAGKPYLACKMEKKFWEKLTGLQKLRLKTYAFVAFVFSTQAWLVKTGIDEVAISSIISDPSPASELEVKELAAIAERKAVREAEKASKGKSGGKTVSANAMLLETISKQNKLIEAMSAKLGIK